MGRLSILLCSLLFVSCSVKKRTTKVSQDIKTEVSTITKVVKQDSIKYDSDTFEIVVEQKDSLKPISVVLNGVESTFSNAKSVTIRKKRKSLKSSEIKSVKLDSIVHVESKTVSSTVDKSIKRSGWKSVFPILLSLLAVYFIGRLIKRYANIWM